MTTLLAIDPGIIIQLRIPGVPVAQPRVKATSRGKHASVYSPTTVKTSTGTKEHPIVLWKAMLRITASREYHGQQLTKAVRVDCCFVFPRPASLMRKKDPLCRIPHTVKPDRDNLDKGVLDALSGILWKDDKLACCGFIEKWYAAAGESPHVMVTVRECAVG